jgi:hypothetical protein
MKNTLVILCLLLSLTSVYAGEWRPYVGVAGLMDIPGKVLSLENPIRLRWDPLYACPGTQFDLGVSIKNHEFYVAYHFSNSSDLSDQYDYSYKHSDNILISVDQTTTKSWHEKKYLLGYRLYPIHSKNQRLDLIIGTALEMILSKEKSSRTETRYQSTINPDLSPSSDIYWTEKYNLVLGGRAEPGVMIESGFSIRAYSGINAVFLSQIHLYEMQKLNFESTTNWYWNGMLITPSFVFQLRYTLGKDN